MLPREHGAYSQMALPVVTSLVFTGAAPVALLFALAVVCGFLAHEPLALLVGGRGARARRETAVPAAVWCTITVLAMVAGGVAAFQMTPASVRWAFLLPLIPATHVAVNVFRKQENCPSTQISVALAFAFATLPMCLSAGVGGVTAALIAFVFASVYVTAVLCVRSIVLSKRGGGNPAASRATRHALVLVALGSSLTMGIAVASALVPWASVTAIIPGLAAAVALATRRSPPPLKVVGWSLALTSMAAALILIGLARHLS